MWTSHLHPVDRRTTKTTLSEGPRVLSFREVILLWQENNEFRCYFTATIGESQFEAFFWETPPVTERTLDQPFEFVLVESASLSQLEADPSPFRSHFSSQKSGEVLTFPNLGGDAILVVPVPLAEEACYTHLARFLRGAPKSQVAALWRTAGLAMANRVSNSPTWLSTAGMGVSWLHLRLDSYPKYYRHEPYKIAG
jgi:hypothetical protein